MARPETTVERSVAVPPDVLVSVTPEGSAPPSRVTSLAALRNLYDDCVRDHEGLAKTRARIRGLIDGNPPFNPAVLEEMGQAWRTNVNFREAEAIIDSNTARLWEMQQELSNLASFKLIDPKAIYEQVSGVDYGAVIAEEYTRLLRSEARFPLYSELVIRDMLSLGVGALVWTDPISWLPKWISISSFLFPSRARCVEDELDYFFIRDELDLARLFDFVKTDAVDDPESEPVKFGWQSSEIKRVLINAFGVVATSSPSGVSDAYQVSPWESVQQSIKNNDVSAQQKQFNGLRVVHAFVRELDGKGGVSHYIFEDKAPLEQKPTNPVDPYSRQVQETIAPSFLFAKPREFSAMSECVWWLLYGYNDGYLRSVKGLGHRIAPHCELSNRFLGQTFDSGVLSSSLMLQGRGGMDSQRLNLLRIGPVTYIPEGTEAVSTAFTPRMDGLVMLRSMSTSLLNNNTGVFRIRSENPLHREAEKSAREVSSEESREARFEKSRVAYFYTQWDKLHQVIANRVLSRSYALGSRKVPGTEAVARFRARCIARGVPDAILEPGLWEATSERVLGLGSPGAVMDITQQMVSIRGMLPEEQQANVIRDFIVARVGARHADRYYPLKPRDEFSSDAASIATLENNDFAEGSWVPVGSEQLHAVHLRIHFIPLVQVVQTSEQDPQALDVQKALPMFTVGLQHIQAHLSYLAMDHLPGDADRERLVKEYVVLFKRLQAFLTHLQDLVRAQQAMEVKQAEQQGKREMELQQALQQQNVEVEKHRISEEIQSKAAIEKYKADLLNQARMSKTQTSIEVAVRRVLNDIANKARLTDAQIETMRRLASAKVEKASGPPEIERPSFLD